jgi:hypothetical protein
VRTVLWANSLEQGEIQGIFSNLASSHQWGIGCKGLDIGGLQPIAPAQPRKLAGNFSKPIREFNSPIREFMGPIREFLLRAVFGRRSQGCDMQIGPSGQSLVSALPLSAP